MYTFTSWKFSFPWLPWYWTMRFSSSQASFSTYSPVHQGGNYSKTHFSFLFSLSPYPLTELVAITATSGPKLPSLLWKLPRVLVYCFYGIPFLSLLHTGRAILSAPCHYFATNQIIFVCSFWNNTYQFFPVLGTIPNLWKSWNDLYIKLHTFTGL